ncbi:AraC family transcriptional regulator [Tannerella forsythia]|uniref:AraC family transcriptional regulator n=1 Tax=Tannerella forsythia TaxID=28112 RepID=A0A3P1XDQ9_TANFO|nr:AraC family transcriptional regulator [Tannerella forsythia]RRD56972.1 AraC family transcriptional regulator [Tannerella forsythia]
MLKEYSISDLLTLPSQHIPYYAGTFEGTEDPEVEWPHRHSFFSLVWFTGGSGFYVIDFEEYEIKPNRIFLVSPKQVHNWDYSESSKGYIITTDYSLGKELNLCCLSPYLDINDKLKNLLEIAFPDLIENFQLRNDISIDIQYIYKQVERFAAKNQQQHYTTNSQLIQFKKLISENRNHLLTINEYAEQLHLSGEQLNTLCKTYTGTSAKQYILDLKITEAKRQLIYTSCNINEIAYSLGFDDSSYFSRIFKKKTSFSPSDFLKKYRKQG